MSENDFRYFRNNRGWGFPRNGFLTFWANANKSVGFDVAPAAPRISRNRSWDCPKAPRPPMQEPGPIWLGATKRLPKSRKTGCRRHRGMPRSPCSPLEEPCPDPEATPTPCRLIFGGRCAIDIFKLNNSNDAQIHPKSENTGTLQNKVMKKDRL